jgi:hypothetical protein
MEVWPLTQLTVPLAADATEFRTQTLVGVLPGFGTARGAPKLQPGEVQLALLPVWPDVVAPIVATGPTHVVIADTHEP